MNKNRKEIEITQIYLELVKQILENLFKEQEKGLLDILSSYARVIKQRVYKLVTGIQNNNTGTGDLDKKEDGLKLNLE